MSRIKKRGLDYFPMNTDFIHNRLVRRVLKREGDTALGVLLQTLCSIYSGEGYYVSADTLFYEDLADCFYAQEAADVERIIRYAVECGIFDATLFNGYGILTSANIQRQFLFITRRRTASLIDTRYNLVPPEETGTQPEDAAALSEETGTLSEDTATLSEDTATRPESPATEAARGNVAQKGGNVTEIPITETFKPENSENAYQSTQSKEKHSIAKQKKANPLPEGSPGTGGTGEGAEGSSAEEVYRRKLESLQPPSDGRRRNLNGLLLNLNQFKIPLPEQYAIVLKTNFGVIGHPLWKGFYVLRDSHGKIRQPGRYLLSLCKAGTEVGV